MVTATGFEKDIDLPGPEKRDRGLLLDVAMPIPADELTYAGVNRFPAGVTWLPWGAGALTTDAVGCSVVHDKQPRDLPDLATQHAFLLYDSIHCSDLASDLDSLRERLDVNFMVYESAAFAKILESGTDDVLGLKGDASHQPQRPNANTAVSVRVAFYYLEQHLASVLSGGYGIIHLNPGLLGLALADHLIYMDAMGRWRTASGHSVIGDAGFTGDAIPNGGSGQAAGTAWIYASGEIWTAISDDFGNVIGETGEGQLHLSRNTNRPLAEKHGLVVFDPDLVGAVKVTIA